MTTQQLFSDNDLARYLAQAERRGVSQRRLLDIEGVLRDFRAEMPAAAIESPYGMPVEDVPIPEGWERDGETRGEWFRRPLYKEWFISVGGGWPVERAADFAEGEMRIIVRRKQSRRWVVEECRAEGQELHVPGSKVRVLIAAELPPIDDALLDRLDAAYNDESGGKRARMRAVLRELGLGE